MQFVGDKELWDKLRSGEKSALKSIYDLHIEYLINYGNKVFRDLPRVEDAIHDLFVEIWNRRERLGSTDSIRKYLAASLRRKIVADLKKTHVLHRVDDPIPGDISIDLSIEDIMINREMSDEQTQRLKGALENLSARQKEIIFLRFYKGLEYEQIADVLGIRYQSLRNLLSGAIKKLRKEMSLLLVLSIIFP